MHMIVTGGSGFLGQQCIASLLKADSLELAPEASTPIRSITAFDVAVGSLQHPKLHYVVGDIADPHQVSALFREDSAAIIHLAAVVSGTAEADFDLGMRVNLDGTRNLLQAARAEPLDSYPLCKLDCGVWWRFACSRARRHNAHAPGLLWHSEIHGRAARSGLHPEGLYRWALGAYSDGGCASWQTQRCGIRFRLKHYP